MSDTEITALTLQLNLEALIREKGFVFLKPLGLIVVVPFKEESFSTELTGIQTNKGFKGKPSTFYRSHIRNTSAKCFRMKHTRDMVMGHGYVAVTSAPKDMSLQLQACTNSTDPRGASKQNIVAQLFETRCSALPRIHGIQPFSTGMCVIQVGLGF